MDKNELLKYLICEIDLVMHDKDYRFENEDGTWYSRESCKNLTNEEVFEELKTELRQLAKIEDEFADLEAKLLEFAHRISDQNEEILELKQQLAEKEKERHEEWLNAKEWKWECDRLKKQLHTANQETLHFKNKYFAENQTAIDELEKVKEKLNKYNKEHCFLSTEIDTCEKAVEFVDQQIKLLKGEE